MKKENTNEKKNNKCYALCCHVASYKELHAANYINTFKH